MKHQQVWIAQSNVRMCITLAAIALCIRAAVFYWYIQPNQYYQQADSNDYHVAALCMRFGFGMSQPDLQRGYKPMFWRTPGYALFLAPWYAAYTPHTTEFQGAANALEAALWLQILLNALLPCIIFYLALLMTQSTTLAWIAGLIVALHLGFVLASTYVLSEGIAILIFYLFLYVWYKQLLQPSKKSWPSIVLAAALLALFTWVRPMGQFIAIVAALMLVIFERTTLRERLLKAGLFLLVFFTCISPWYIRNYTLTSHWFFCPMFGNYLCAFCAPRALSTATNIPLLTSWQQLMHTAQQQHHIIAPEYAARGLFYPIELATADTAWPVVLRYPWHVLYDWVRESCKTAFDLYSNQLVAFVQNTYFYDPLIEYLTEKWRECLYSVPMAWPMRLLVYLEALYMLWLWIGLIGGCIRFVLMPLYYRSYASAQNSGIFYLWVTIIPLVACAIGMTGGFGYARLRLPVEGLMIILALTFWQYLCEAHRLLSRGIARNSSEQEIPYSAKACKGYSTCSSSPD